ncbi:helix-turn-helix transcriptional regulator [Sphingomonas melonis]|jgi:DNA-binding XRE family transcriptional regulator|uniref:helix-turn-helix transcriptional regulator n=1 Tax=Sphingomonas melonis TaxID=152682 RepID=UPI00037A5838|nr:helix-turn-helix domain-containing protein [Sphingomonas melonis]ATI54174.1 transcriptional regulator [Sphingomonas melonis]
MKPDELKALRKGTGLSQQGLANHLGVSRKFVNEMENGAPIDSRTELAVQTLARKVKLISDLFWVDESNRNTFIVIRRTEKEHDRPNALYWGHSETILYGEFNSRKHAERWARALRQSDDPRGTQKLLRARAAEVAAREATNQD